MSYTPLAVLVSATTLLSALILARGIHRMTQALTDAVNRLTIEVTETLDDVAQALRDAANNTDDEAAAAAINAQADRLDAFQATLPQGEDTVAGGDTVAG